MSDTRSYNSPLRQEQAEATRERILGAMAAILEEEGMEAATNKAVAARAGVREVTVYRHFPNREALLSGLWTWMNGRGGVTVGFPKAEHELVDKIGPLFKTFDAAPGHILATLTTAHGREMRGSLNAERQEIFLAAIAGATETLPEAEKRKAAAVLQLLYSGYAWISLREQWDLKGQPAADAVAWAAETLLAALRARGSAPLQPAPSGASPSQKASS